MTTESFKKRRSHIVSYEFLRIRSTCAVVPQRIWKWVVVGGEFLSCARPFFGSASTISRFGERPFVVVSTVWSVSSLLFCYSWCPRAQPFAICKSWGCTCSRALWSRRHWICDYIQLNAYYCMLFSSIVTVRIRFSVWLVSGSHCIVSLWQLDIASTRCTAVRFCCKVPSGTVTVQVSVYCFKLLSLFCVYFDAAFVAQKTIIMDRFPNIFIKNMHIHEPYTLILNSEH